MMLVMKIKTVYLARSLTQPESRSVLKGYYFFFQCFTGTLGKGSHRCKFLLGDGYFLQGECFSLKIEAKKEKQIGIYRKTLWLETEDNTCPQQPGQGKARARARANFIWLSYVGGQGPGTSSSTASQGAQQQEAGSEVEEQAIGTVWSETWVSQAASSPLPQTPSPKS